MAINTKKVELINANAKIASAGFSKERQNLIWTTTQEHEPHATFGNA